MTIIKLYVGFKLVTLLLYSLQDSGAWKSDCDLPYEQQHFHTVEVRERARFTVVRPSSAKAPVANLQNRLYNYTVLLPEELLQLSRVHASNRRLLRFASKLVQGEPVSVLAIGGSVTEGAGVRTIEHSYISIFFEWLRRTFPNEDHRLKNAAIGGTSSYVFQHCIGELTSDGGDANESEAHLGLDLVLMEFSVNDLATLPTDKQRGAGYESLLRKLLALPSGPALLGLHVFAPHFNGGWEKGGDSGYSTSSAEDVHARLLEYYQVPSLSARRMLFHAVTSPQAAPGSGLTDDEVWCDSVHPSKLGHRYYADMVVSYMVDMVDLAMSAATATSASIAQPMGGQQQEQQQERAGSRATTNRHLLQPWVPQAPQQQQRRQQQGAGASEVEGNLAAAAAAGQSQQPPLGVLGVGDLPRPLYRGAESDESSCLLMEALRASVVQKQGFDWVDERRGSRSRWGFVAHEPGSTITFKVNASEPQCGEGRVLQLALGFLKTYEAVGAARLECRGGCGCGPQEWSARHIFRASVTHWIYTRPEGLAPGGTCDLHLEVVQHTETGGHKFKVTAISKSCVKA